MKKFEFLKEPFINWVNDKRQGIEQFQKFNPELNENEIIENAIIDNIEDIDNALNTLDCLPPDKINLIFQRFIYYYKNFIGNKAPVLFNINFEINNMPNALDWVLVNIAELNFFDMSGIEYKKIYNQCHYCGKPDEFEHKSGNKKFNKKRKYCHIYDCDFLKITDGSNPLQHELCCFGKYALSKKKLYQQMKAAKVPRKEKIEKFISYCDNKLKECEKIKWTVQTKEQKAIFESDWYES